MLKTDDVLYNHHKDTEEKIGKLYVLKGNKPEEVKELHAGDIGALAKLTNTATTDSLSTKANPILYTVQVCRYHISYMRYKAKNKGEKTRSHRHCRNDLRRSYIKECQ